MSIDQPLLYIHFYEYATVVLDESDDQVICESIRDACLFGLKQRHLPDAFIKNGHDIHITRQKR